jgi:hypothetical protein
VPLPKEDFTVCEPPMHRKKVLFTMFYFKYYSD